MAEWKGVVHKARLGSVLGTAAHSLRSQHGVEQHERHCDCVYETRNLGSRPILPLAPSLLHLERHAVVDLQEEEQVSTGSRGAGLRESSEGA